MYFKDQRGGEEGEEEASLNFLNFILPSFRFTVLLSSDIAYVMAWLRVSATSFMWGYLLITLLLYVKDCYRR